MVKTGDIPTFILMIKVTCGECGWSFRTAQSNIDAMTDHTCLACGDGTLSTGE